MSNPDTDNEEGIFPNVCIVGSLKHMYLAHTINAQDESDSDDVSRNKKCGKLSKAQEKQQDVQSYETIVSIA